MKRSSVLLGMFLLCAAPQVQASEAEVHNSSATVIHYGSSPRDPLPGWVRGTLDILMVLARGIAAGLGGRTITYPG